MPRSTDPFAWGSQEPWFMWGVKSIFPLGPSSFLTTGIFFLLNYEPFCCCPTNGRPMFCAHVDQPSCGFVFFSEYTSVWGLEGKLKGQPTVFEGPPF